MTATRPSTLDLEPLPLLAGEAGAECLSPVPNPGKLRVLLLDDEPFVREALSGMLEHLGHHVVAVSTGEEAVARYRDALAQSRFDLVCVDLVNHCGMGGLETMQQLLAIDPGVAAVFSSGYSDDFMLKFCLSHGFRGCLPKPADFQELQDCLRLALASR